MYDIPDYLKEQEERERKEVYRDMRKTLLYFLFFGVVVVLLIYWGTEYLEIINY